MKKIQLAPPLLYADSEHNSDQLYFGRFFAPDPFISFGHGRKKFAVLNALEIVRGKRESTFDEILSLEEWREKAKKLLGIDKAGIPEIIVTIARELGIGRFRVAPDFPLGLARKLEVLKLEIEVPEGGLFPEREIKSREEAEAIRLGNQCSAAGIGAAEQLLRKASIRAGKLYFKGKYLTSERLKEEIDTACLRAGSIAGHTIAAGGLQACDPHCTGSGVLRANELIIVDVFPRVTDTGFYGDMTRTFLKGKASDAQKRLVETVRESQKQAIAAVKSGASGDRIHRGILELFEKRGFETKTDSETPVGFFHGSGHGLGLAIHELPRISAGAGRLRVGQVVTIEPGLYYPDIGGARFEDVVWVQKDGSEMLSKYPYDWELR